jgi:hypothetical protein
MSAYTHEKHFQEILKNAVAIQEYDTTIVPPHICTDVQSYLSDMNLTCNTNNVRRALHSLKYCKYYEYCALIQQLLGQNIIFAPITPEKIKILTEQFNKILSEFYKQRGDRVNFLNYNFVVLKLLVYNKFMDESVASIIFPQMRSPEKVNEANEMWNKIQPVLDKTDLVINFNSYFQFLSLISICFLFFIYLIST